MGQPEKEEEEKGEWRDRKGDRGKCPDRKPEALASSHVRDGADTTWPLTVERPMGLFPGDSREETGTPTGRGTVTHDARLSRRRPPAGFEGAARREG